MAIFVFLFLSQIFKLKSIYWFTVSLFYTFRSGSNKYIENWDCFAKQINHLMKIDNRRCFYSLTLPSVKSNIRYLIFYIFWMATRVVILFLHSYFIAVPKPQTINKKKKRFSKKKNLTLKLIVHLYIFIYIFNVVYECSSFLRTFGK